MRRRSQHWARRIWGLLALLLLPVPPSFGAKWRCPDGRSCPDMARMQAGTASSAKAGSGGFCAELPGWTICEFVVCRVTWDTRELRPHSAQLREPLPAIRSHCVLRAQSAPGPLALFPGPHGSVEMALQPMPFRLTRPFLVEEQVFTPPVLRPPRYMLYAYPSRAPPLT